MAINLLIAVLFHWIGYRAGYEHAHVTVARECKALGGFYVGEDIFKCVKVTHQERKP